MNTLLASCVLVCLLGGISCIVDPDFVTEPDLNPSTGVDKESTRQDEIAVTSTTLHNLSESATSDQTEVPKTNFTSNVTEEEELVKILEEKDSSKDIIEPEVDENGCQITVRDELEGLCFHTFEIALEGSIHIKDTAESEKSICCAVEEYEKCCVRGYKVTNCADDKESLKETLKAARIFLGALTNISCSGHRGQCAVSSSGRASAPYLFLAAVVPLLIPLL